MDRNETIKRIRTALRFRSGKAWSVTGGRGTAWGWIKISSPPARSSDFGMMSIEDAAELGMMLDLTKMHHQGVLIPASNAHRIEYVDRAEGREPTAHGEQYWD